MKKTYLLLVFTSFFSCSKKLEKRIVYSEYFKGVIESKSSFIKGTDIKEGLCVVFNRKGDTLTKSYYSKGKLNGKQITYNANKVHNIINYKNDKLHGIAQCFFNDGKLKHEVEYRNGLLWNVLMVYDLRGNRLDFGNFKKGNGVLKVYYDNGQLKDKGLMQNGRATGEWLNYTDTGDKQKVIYNNGYNDWGLEVIFF